MTSAQGKTGKHHYLVLMLGGTQEAHHSMSQCLLQVEDIDYRCMSALEMKEGVELLRAHAPDCILLDAALDPDGLPVKTHVPVVLLTPKGGDIAATQALQQGAVNYLVTSSITCELLHRTITSAIDHAMMERRLMEQRRRIEEQAEELECINEELETFAYIASHDLRSPLVGLKAFSGELFRSLNSIIPMLENIIPKLTEIEGEILRKEVCQRIPRSLAYINDVAEKMDRMTSAILRLSRLGHLETVSETVDTRRIVDQCLASLEKQIESSQTQVEVGALPRVLGNPTAIEQVFGNILDNAIKYLEPQRPGRITVSGRQDGGQVIFTIEDNGRGIFDSEMHKVFEIFRRADDVEHIPGEGMGMSYVRAIIKRHGGTIWCESKRGQGTTFHFTIANRADGQKAA